MNQYVWKLLKEALLSGMAKKETLLIAHFPVAIRLSDQVKCGPNFINMNLGSRFLKV